MASLEEVCLFIIPILQMRELKFEVEDRFPWRRDSGLNGASVRRPWPSDSCGEGAGGNPTLQEHV